MLSAIRTEGRKQVILLREDGLACAEQLREEAREGRLVCEVCAQPVVVRAGEERIWHFAHRARANCPKAQDSLEIVECRALLYGWLRIRFPDAIQLEKVLPGLPRPLDCWVDRPGQASLAWWLISAAVKPEVRDSMSKGCQHLGAHLHPVFPARMLEHGPGHSGRVTLTATLRELVETSAYGQIYGGFAESLHFLDPGRRHLVTCRGLLATHPPQGYRATLLDNPLEEVRLHPRNGEFVHPGEFEALKAFREEVARQRRLEEERRERHRRPLEAERKREQLRREKLEADRLDNDFTQVPTALDWVAEPPAQPAALPEPPVGPLLTCKVCGEQTRDWVVLYGSTGFCKCRNCAH